MTKQALKILARWLRVAADVIDIIADWFGKDKEKDK